MSENSMTEGKKRERTPWSTHANSVSARSAARNAHSYWCRPSVMSDWYISSRLGIESLGSDSRHTLFFICFRRTIVSVVERKHESVKSSEEGESRRQSMIWREGWSRNRRRQCFEGVYLPGERNDCLVCGETTIQRYGVVSPGKLQGVEKKCNGGKKSSGVGVTRPTQTLDTTPYAIVLVVSRRSGEAL